MPIINGELGTMLKFLVRWPEELEFRRHAKTIQLKNLKTNNDQWDGIVEDTDFLDGVLETFFFFHLFIFA